MYKTWFMGTLDSVTCTSAIFAWWKVRGGNFAEAPDGGRFRVGGVAEGLVHDCDRHPDQNPYPDRLSGLGVRKAAQIA